MFPFSVLAPTSAFFVYTTVEQKQFPWPGEASFTVDLAAGLNLLAETGLAGFSMVGALLGEVGEASFRLYGSFSPMPGEALPVGALRAPIKGGSLTLGQAPFTLSLDSPAVVLSIGATDADHPFQEVTLSVEGVLQKTLVVAASLPEQGSDYVVSVAPLPASGSIPSLIKVLPGGESFTTLIPAELKEFFAAVSLEGFTMIVDGTPKVTLLGLAIGATSPWTLINDVLKLEGMTLVVEVLDPSGINWRRVLVSAQASFLPKVFRDPFDFQVAIQSAGSSWEVGTISGAYHGVVRLGDLVAGFGVDSVPKALEDIRFSDFGVTATRSAPKAPFDHTLYGSAETAFPLLDTQLTSGLSFVFATTSAGTSFKLVGQLVIGEEAFSITFTRAGLSASWEQVGGPLDLGDVATSLGWDDLPSLPGNLDLSLTKIDFAYDFGASSLTLLATSLRYGQFVLVTRVVNGQRVWLVDLALSLKLQLSGIPLVGAMLPSDVALQNFQFLAVSQSMTSTDLAAVNALIAQLQPLPDPVAGDPDASAGLSKGVMLSGTLAIGSAVQASMFLQFGGGTTPASPPGTSTGGGQESTQPAASTPPPNPGPASRTSIGKSAGPIRFDSVGLVFVDGDIGVKFNAALSLAILDLDLLGLSVAVPASVLSDPSKLADITFNLDGLSLDLEKGPLALSLAFLRKTYKDSNGQSYDEYAGLVRLGFKQVGLVGVGAFAMYEGHPSVYLFVALAVPLGGPPAFFVNGVMAGFGANRAFIPPPIDQVADFPFIAMAAPFPKVPSTSSDLNGMMDQLHASLPPRLGEYWFAAGVQFRSFGIVQTLGLVVIQFGRDLELDILGVSSVILPTAFIELQFQLRFVPAAGYLLAQGQLTNRSFFLMPMAHLTGGFAAGFWFSGEFEGDYVVSVGGYNPRFTVPAHYPNNIPRLGINFQMPDVPMQVKGGVYFAMTPQAIMAGGNLEAVFNGSLGPFGVYASLLITADLIVYYEPFHFEAEIDISAHVRVTIKIWFVHVHFDVQIRAGLQLWGPPFAGIASLHVGPKTFKLAFGSTPRGIKPLQWGAFNTEFLPANGPGSITVTGGLLKQVTWRGATVFVVNPKEMAITTDSVMPLSSITGVPFDVPGDIAQCGIAPMDLKTLNASCTLSIAPPAATSASFEGTAVLKNVPKALWGQGFPETGVAKQANGVLTNALAGVRIVPGNDPEAGVTHTLSRDNLAFETTTYTGPRLSTGAAIYGATSKPTPPLMSTVSAFSAFTGLASADVDISDLAGSDPRFALLSPVVPQVQV